jgi:ELWxxDGT repeat protein
VADLNTLAGNSFGGWLGTLSGTLFLAADDGIHGTELWKTDGTLTGTVLVADIHPGSASAFDPFVIHGEGAVCGGRLFFVASDGSSGWELWRTDGTPGGTARVADVNPAGSSYPRHLTVMNDTLFFAATDGISGTELWRSDGTPTGTVQVADLNPTGSSDPMYLTALGDTLFFAATDGANGTELWKSDGSPGGTVPVADLNPAGSSDPAYLTVLGDRLYFAATDGISGTELWKSDGGLTTTVQVADINPSGDANPQELVALGDTLFFAATDGISGTKLWKSDGTPGGTTLGPDINPVWGSMPHYLTVVSDTLFFAATDSISGTGLWKSDGTPGGTTRLANVTPLYLTGTSDTLFFAADDGVHGLELWKSDGTPAGTVMVKDIHPQGSSIGLPTWPDWQVMATLGDTLFLAAEDDRTREELWKSDGTAEGTVMVRNINRATDGSDPRGLTAFQDRLFFQATQDIYRGSQLWRSDGTAAGTVLLAELFSDYNPWPQGWPVISGLMFLPANDGVHGFELWKTDGSVTGTRMVMDINPVGDAFPFPFEYELAVLGDRLFFPANDGSSGIELWQSDGTPTGTARVADIHPAGSSAPGDLTVVGDRLFFVADDGSHGRELWVSDGTLTGTRMVADINPLTGFTTGDWTQLAALGDVLFFAADDGTHGYELWRSDGTLTGTRMVSDVHPAGSALDFWPHLTPLSDCLFFGADDGSHGVELWQSDGTVTGTRLVRDIRPGPNGSWPGSGVLPMVLSDTLFFVADDGSHGLELWKTDGSAADTVLVKDVNPGAGGLGGPLNYWLPAVFSDTLFFNADDGSSGTELWRSDGTPTGTVRVADINPGTRGSYPRWMRVAGDTLFFSADDGFHGLELWALDRVPRLANLTLSAQPDALLANGLDTSLLTVTATDAAGSGTLFAGQAVTLNWSLGWAPGPVSVTLGATGVATYTYTAGTTPGSALLTATMDYRGVHGVATTTLQLHTNPLQGRLTSQFGPVITYTFVASNVDPLNTQTHVVMTGSLPADTALVGVSGGHAVPSGGDYGWGYVQADGFDLAPGARYTLTWTVRPLSLVGDIYTQAHAASDTAALRLGLVDRIHRLFISLVSHKVPR